MLGRVLAVIAITGNMGVLAPQASTQDTNVHERAASGDAEAQYTLGVMYDVGNGVPENDATAVRWYRQAAEQGHAEAQFNLGVMHANGEGVPQDYTAAVRWYRQAAEQGDALAQYNLGLMYSLGKGVPRDYVAAHMWLNLAASRMTGNDHQRAAQARERAAAQMSPQDVQEAQRLAREWQPNRP